MPWFKEPLNTWVTGTGSSSQRPASGDSHSGAHTLRHQLHHSTGSRVLPRHLPTALIFTTACRALWPSLASTPPPRGGHRMLYKALSPSGSFCFLPSSQLLLLCISSVTDILFFSSLHLHSLAKGSLGTGLVYKDPSPFSSFLHYCLSVLYQKKKSMGQVSENRSLTAEGEKERPWQTKQQLF